MSVTRIEDARQTIEVTREAFYREGLQSAWERVIAVVVQPGVEFGDDFVLEYQPQKAKELSRFIESEAIIYEAHSTDYQTRAALKTCGRSFRNSQGWPRVDICIPRICLCPGNDGRRIVFKRHTLEYRSSIG